MSKMFSKTPVKRFNDDRTKKSIGPGTYNPRFPTDVGAPNCCVETRRSDGPGKLPVVYSKPRFSITRPRSAMSTISSQLKARPSISGRKVPEPPVEPKREPEVNMNEEPKEPEKVSSFHHMIDYNDGSRECQSVIEEIQQMAGKLQEESEDWKRKLMEEEAIKNALNEERQELKVQIQTLSSELRRYETERQEWKLEEASYKEKLEQVVITKIQLEKQLRDIRIDMKTLKDQESMLSEKLATLDEEKVKWQAEKIEYEETLQKLVRNVKANDLLSELEACYGTQPEGADGNENESEAEAESGDTTEAPLEIIA